MVRQLNEQQILAITGKCYAELTNDAAAEDEWAIAYAIRHVTTSLVKPGLALDNWLASHPFLDGVNK